MIPKTLTALALALTLTATVDAFPDALKQHWVVLHLNSTASVDGRRAIVGRVVFEASADPNWVRVKTADWDAATRLAMVEEAGNGSARAKDYLKSSGHTLEEAQALIKDHPAKEIWLNMAQVVSIEEVYDDASHEPLPLPEFGQLLLPKKQ